MSNRMRLVSEAVNDAEWQAFRKALKGLSTREKLVKLEEYWYEQHESVHGPMHHFSTCYVCLRVDNYLKALARGGQLHAGVNVEQAVDGLGISKLPIRK